MKLQLGQKVKVVKLDGKQRYKKTGKVTLIEKHYIQIEFKNYRECFTKSDIMTGDWIQLYIKQGKELIRVTKEMIK